MHHLPAGPPVSARLAALLRRLSWRLRALVPSGAGLRAPVRRLALGLGCTLALTALVVAVPVVSGAGGEETPVALDSSATTSADPGQDDEPVVVMGVDGDGTSTSSSASRGERPAGSAAPAEGSTEQADDPSTESATGAPAPPGTTSSTRRTSTAPAGTTTRSAPARTPSRSPSSPPSSPPPPSTEPPVASPTPSQADLEAQLVALVSQARTEAGCASSQVDPALADVARRHSAAMAASGVLSAVDLAAWAVRGAAVGHGPADPATVVAQWLADPAAGAQLLDCAATGLGAGVADGPWYTVVLA